MQFKMENEIQQFTEASIELNAKLGEEDAKIKNQQMQKEKILEEIKSFTELTVNAQQECDEWEQRKDNIQKQLTELNAKNEDLAKYPEILRAQQKAMGALEVEVAELKAKLKKLKPESQPTPPKVSAICEIQNRIENPKRIFSFVYR